MKTFRKSLVLLAVFFIGTASLIHVDRQCAQINGGGSTILTVVEKLFDK